ncbi:hypothetical protein HYW59_02975 [Candidatus Kaiserbacteria bacterium]|nr:hypothetical protein [Candidatus Kaiserbacteria bacterium]
MVPAFVRAGVSPESIPALSMRMRFGRDSWEEGGINWDTEAGIVLRNAKGRWKKKPVALVGFKPDWDMLIVEQLQGVGGKKKVFSSIRWERLLVWLLVTLAQETGWYDEVCIVPARKLHWYDHPVGKKFKIKDSKKRAIRLKEHQTRLSARYDGTARALGFKWDGHRELWVHKLKTG